MAYSKGGQYSKTLEDGSEPVYDFQCSPCGKEDKHMEAFNACVECRQNLCSTCLKYHNRFEGMSGHTILDKAGMMARGPQAPLSLLKEKCKLHPGEVINMYCGAHDVVCCGVCIHIDHRLCKGVDYLPTAAKGSKINKRVGTAKKELQKLHQELAKMKNIRQADLTKIDQDKIKSIKDIDDFRDELVRHLDKMVKEAEDEVNTKHSKVAGQIDTSIKDINEMKMAVESNIKHLDKCQGQDEVQEFLYVKQGTTVNTDGRMLLQELETNLERESKTINYQINSNIKDYITNLKSLGDIKVTMNQKLLKKDSLIIRSATLHGKYDMKVRGDKKTYDMSDVSVLDNGCILISDDNNNKLKLLDQTYRVINTCSLPGHPSSMCSTGPREVATVLWNINTMLFVTTTSNNKITLTKSFQIADRCRYVAFSKDELFVTCMNKSVIVYNLTGDQKYLIGSNNAGQSIFSDPRAITISTDGSKIIVADSDKGVITMDRLGHQQSTFTHPSLTDAWGVCLLENENLLVSGYNSHNILEIDKDRTTCQCILTETEGLYEPRSLRYDGVNSRLIVTMEQNNKIKVFNLMRK